MEGGGQCTVRAHAVRYGGVYRPREGVAHYCTEAPPMSPLGVLLYALPLWGRVSLLCIFPLQEKK